jgi:hypothetical protein
MVNNTFVNSLGRGMFVFIAAADTTPALLENNFFSGGGAVTNQASAVLTTNFVGTPSFVNAAGYDYHLMAASAGIDAGTTPGAGSGYSLIPADEYVHPTCGETRRVSGIIDIGAFEYNGSGPILGCAINPVPPTLGSLSVKPFSLTGGATATGNTVTLIGTAGSQGASIALASSDPHATVPAAVTVPAGESSAGFSIATSPVNAPTVATISGSYRGQTVSADLTIRPTPPALASVTLASTTIRSGAMLYGNLVTLTAPAPCGGATILLQSGNPSVVWVPASIVVPAGTTSATFPLNAGGVWKPTSVSVGVSYVEKASQVFLTVQPLHVR